VCTGKVLAVIGPISKAASIKREAEASEWQALAERLQRVADATACSVMVIHHTRKPGQEYGPPRTVPAYFDSVRGSNALVGALDFGLGVQRDPDATEGVLYSLQRDGESGRLSYDFDPQSLCIWPSDRPVGKVTVADRREQVYAFIEAHPGCSRSDIRVGLDIGERSLALYLNDLGERVKADGQGRTPRTYTVAE
jgi:hypothetical protein